VANCRKMHLTTREQRPGTWLTPWMMVLGLELAVVLELERRGGPSQGSTEEGAAAASPPGGHSGRGSSVRNSTSLASPSAAWLGGSKAKGEASALHHIS